MWKKGCQWCVVCEGSVDQMKKKTHHHFNHHAAVGACESTATQRVYELRDDTGHKEHGDAHGS